MINKQQSKKRMGESNVLINESCSSENKKL